MTTATSADDSGALMPAEHTGSSEALLYDLYDLFEGRYELARRALLISGEKTDGVDIRAAANMRDALDHFVRLMECLREREPDLERAYKEFAHMEEHISRAANEGMEVAAERRILELEDQLLPPIFYTLAREDVPDRDEIEADIQRAWALIAEGRSGKPERVDHQANGGPQEAVTVFHEALELAEETLDNVPDRKKTLPSVGFGMLVPVVALIVSLFSSL